MPILIPQSPSPADFSLKFSPKFNPKESGLDDYLANVLLQIGLHDSRTPEIEQVIHVSYTICSCTLAKQLRLDEIGLRGKYTKTLMRII